MITCRACGGGAWVGVDHVALLCHGCLSDLPAAAQRVADAYATAMAAFFAAGKALEQASANSAWYAKTERARADVDPALFARAWAAARAEGGEKRALIELREAMDDAAEAMRAAELVYLASAPELRAARMAHGSAEPLL